MLRLKDSVPIKVLSIYQYFSKEIYDIPPCMNLEFDTLHVIHILLQIIT